MGFTPTVFILFHDKLEPIKNNVNVSPILENSTMYGLKLSMKLK